MGPQRATRPQLRRRLLRVSTHHHAPLPSVSAPVQPVPVMMRARYAAQPFGPAVRSALARLAVMIGRIRTRTLTRHPVLCTPFLLRARCGGGVCQDTDVHLQGAAGRGLGPVGNAADSPPRWYSPPVVDRSPKPDRTPPHGVEGAAGERSGRPGCRRRTRRPDSSAWRWLGRCRCSSHPIRSHCVHPSSRGLHRQTCAHCAHAWRCARIARGHYNLLNTSPRLQGASYCLTLP